MTNNEELIKRFNDFLDDTEMIKYIDRYYDLKRPRECFNKEAVESIELNIKFFKDIPKERLEGIFICLAEIFHEYNVSSQNEEFCRLINDYKLKRYKKKPSLQISEDLNIIKRFKETFRRISSIETKKDLPNLYKVLDKITKDLEDKDFNIIDKSKYYRPERPNKKQFKEFFKVIRKKFNLKGVSLEEQQMINSFTSYIAVKK